MHKNRLKNTLLIIGAMLGFTLVNAQNPIPSGLLKEKAPQFANWQIPNGSAESPAINQTAWRQFYHEFSLQQQADMPKATSFFNLPKKNEPQIVNLLVLLFEYNQFAEDIQELPVTWNENELETKPLFAFTLQKNYTFNGLNQKFRLNAENIWGNLNGFQFSIDFGQGFMPLGLNQDFEVAFGSTGNQIITLKAEKDNEVFYARSKFEVKGLRNTDPDQTWEVESDYPYNDSIATGEVYVVLGEGNTSLTNPVVLLEGFDFANLTNFEELYFLLQQQNMAQTLLDEGYDLVILNYDNATEPIQRNGLLAATVLEMIADSISAESSMAVIGVSMGGLVGRYALLHLEDMEIEHKVRNFISVDSPQTGATIPLGLQHLFNSTILGGFLGELDFLNAALDSESAQQMLLYHHTGTSGLSANSASLRSEFLDDLDDKGNWPTQTRLVSMVNGSGTGIAQDFAIGDTLIAFSANVSGFNGRGVTRTIRNQASSNIYRIETQVFIWIPLEQRNVNNTYAEENAPGAPLGLIDGFDDIAFEGGSLNAKNLNPCFIPSLSAMGIVTTDYYQDMTDFDFEADSPFDNVYFQSENQQHVEITASNAEWLIEEITMSTVSVSELAVKEKSLRVFPNPAKNQITLLLPFSQPIEQLEIFDMQGKLVKTIGSTVNQKNISLPVNHLTAGLYMVRITANKTIFNAKFIKQ